MKLASSRPRFLRGWETPNLTRKESNFETLPGPISIVVPVELTNNEQRL